MKEQILPRGVAAGLTDEQVLASRRLHGANTLTKRKRKGFFRQYLSSFGDPIIKILLVALAINVIFLFRNSDWMESAGIAVAVFLATFVSTLSQYGSESAFIELQRASANIECRVRRAGGVRSLPVGELVVGDIVLLEAGEKIPADGVLLSGKLSVDRAQRRKRGGGKIAAVRRRGLGSDAQKSAFSRQYRLRGGRRHARGARGR